MIEICVMTYRREDVQALAVVGNCIADAIRGEHRQFQGSGNPNRSLIPPLFLTFLMALQLNVDALTTKDVNQLLYSFSASNFAAVHQRSCQRSFVSTRKANQPGCVLLYIFECGCALSLGLIAHLEPRDELAEVLIAF